MVTKATFTFLRDLKKNNQRTWFHARMQAILARCFELLVGVASIGS